MDLKQFCESSGDRFVCKVDEKLNDLFWQYSRTPKYGSGAYILHTSKSSSDEILKRFMWIQWKLFWKINKNLDFGLFQTYLG